MDLVSRSPVGTKPSVSRPIVAGSGDSYAKQPACHLFNRSRPKLRLLARIILCLEGRLGPTPVLLPALPSTSPVWSAPHRDRSPYPCEPGTSSLGSSRLGQQLWAIHLLHRSVCLLGADPPRTAAALGGRPRSSSAQPRLGDLRPHRIDRRADIRIQPCRLAIGASACPKTERSPSSTRLRELSAPSTRERQARIAKLEGLRSAEGPHRELADVVA